MLAHFQQAVRVLLRAIGHASVLFSTQFWTAHARLRLWALGVTGARHLRMTGPLILDLHHKADVHLGDGVRLNSGYSRNAVGGSRRVVVVTKAGARLIIGSNVGISNSTIVCACRVTIEDDVLVGGGCDIWDTDFHVLPGARLLSPMAKPVRIGRGAFIGGNSTILKGVTIGEGAIVGAGSVVAKNVPSLQVWAGNPARFIRLVEE